MYTKRDKKTNFLQMILSHIKRKLSLGKMKQREMNFLQELQSQPVTKIPKFVVVVKLNQYSNNFLHISFKKVLLIYSTSFSKFDTFILAHSTFKTHKFLMKLSAKPIYMMFVVCGLLFAVCCLQFVICMQTVVCSA